MKKIQIIIICLTLLLGKSNAQVTIGTGTNTNEGIPVFPVFTYNYSQNIYLASEINAIGNIATLTYYVTPTSYLSNSNNWTIYMGHTTKTSFASTGDWVPANYLFLTQVFSGTVSVSGGMVHIILDTLFNYNGTDNLIIAIDENTPGADGSGNSFYSSTVAANRAISYRNTTTNPNPNSPPTATSVSSRIANVTLGGLGQAGPAPSQLNDTSVTTNSVDLSWTENGTATKWNIQWGISGFAFGTGNMVTGVTSNSFNLTGLQPGRYYQFYVQADYDMLGVSSWSDPYLFYTIGIPQFKFHLAFEDATGAKDTLWFIFDSLGTDNYDPIFNEQPVLLSTSNFEVYIEQGTNYIKTIAGSSNNSYISRPIEAQNYVYPLTMRWDSSLLFNNNLPFNINTASLDNEWFFFQSDGSLHHQYNMLTADSNYVNLPTFTWGSQEQFPLIFSFGYDPFLSTNEKINEKNHLMIYPNPVDGYLCVQVVNENVKDFSLKIIDALGNAIINKNRFSNSLKMDVSSLSNGIYFIEVYNDSISYRKKIIKY